MDIFWLIPQITDKKVFAAAVVKFLPRLVVYLSDIFGHVNKVGEIRSYLGQR